MNETELKETGLVQLICPCCKGILTHSTNPKTSRVPVKGGISICIKCGELLTFDQDTQLQRLSDKDFYALPDNQQYGILNFRAEIMEMIDSTKNKTEGGKR